MADIQNLDLNASATRGIEVKLFNPVTREPITDDNGASVIGVYGVDSDEWKRHDKRIRSERDEPLGPMDTEAQQEHTLKVLAACTFKVENLAFGDTVFTPKNIIDLYLKPGFHWTWEQVLTKAQSRAALDIANIAKKN